jgi:lipopolysaccharide transport system ATP-binding protein
MSDTVIKVENLSKQYRIGAKEAYKTFRETLMDAAKVPFLLCRDITKRAIKPFSSSQSAQAHSNQNTIWALKDVSFEINRGEVVGVIGRNGAGKSTLLKILSKITEPTKGRLELRGRVGSLLEVGTGFHPELTGHENVYLYGAILGMDRWEVTRKFDEIIAFAELEKFVDTPVKRYSSGMYMRLAFAVAAHLEPEILLVDEVLAVGDAAFQKKCMGKMGDVAKEGRTVLFVSHNMPAIEALCRKTLLIDAGSLVGLGETSDIVEKYMSGMINKSRAMLATDKTENIRSVTIKNADGIETDEFFVGDDIIFEIDLFHETMLDRPRLSIGLHNTRGERIVTIHTDIQQNDRWSFQGPKRVRAVWKNNMMVPYRYRVDVSLWGYSNEIEYLPGCRTLEIMPRDVYGTGELPDPSFQGYLLPDAHWDINSD